MTQEMQWVAQSSTTSACDSGGIGSNAMLQVTESVTWRAPVRPHRSKRRPRSLLRPAPTRRRPARSASRCSNAAGMPSPNIAGLRSPVRRAAVSGDHVRRVRVLRVLDARRVHRVGDRRHRCQRPGAADVPSQATSVTVGQTTSMTFNYDTAATITVTGWTGSAATPATNIPIGIANTSAAAVPARTRTPRARRRSRHSSRTRAATRCSPGNCTDNNPVGLDTSRNVFYAEPGHDRDERDAGRDDHRRRSRCTTCR